MKRIVRLVRATDREICRPHYQQGLQAMWEDRLGQLGSDARLDWSRRHGTPPPALCPLLCPQGPKVRLQVRLGRSGGTLAGRLLRCIRKAFPLRKGDS